MGFGNSNPKPIKLQKIDSHLGPNLELDIEVINIYSLAFSYC